MGRPTQRHSALALVVALGGGLCCGEREDSTGSGVWPPDDSGATTTGDDPFGSTSTAATRSAGDDASGTSGTAGTTVSDNGDGNSTGPSTDDQCARADILCDDFESDSLEAQWAYTGDPAKTPTLDSTRSHGGAQSLGFLSADTRGAFVFPAAGLPTANNRVYARTYVSFDQPMAKMGGHVAYLVGANAPENGVEVRLGASRNFSSQEMMVDVNFIGDGQEHTQFSNGDATGQGGSSAPGVALDANRWYCIEALFDGASDEFRAWIDGAEVEGLHVTDWQAGRTDWSPSYAAIKIGVHNYSGDIGPVWFDDVAIGTTRQGCVR